MRMKWKRLHSGRSPFKIHVMRATGTLSQSIARQVVESDFATLPPSTVHACKRSIIDGVATLLAGSGTAESEAFVDVARYMDSNGVATVFGYGERTSPVMAALCNGAMAHALDFGDAFDPVPSHPNASLLPAAFALSQYSAAVSGQEFITAVAVGCDLACRIGLSLRRPLEAGGWYPPPIIGAFGALAASARLLRLTADQVLDAFSLLLLTNGCPGEIKHSVRTVLRGVREAFPAQSALQAVVLASRSVRGFERPFEGVNGFSTCMPAVSTMPVCCAMRASATTLSDSASRNGPASAAPMPSSSAYSKSDSVNAWACKTLPASS
jgi:2-methylcitrate dehydratase PrpD